MDPILRQKSLHTVEWNGEVWPCSVGTNGVSLHKKEGDLATPIGIFRLEQIFYRADRIIKPKTVLPLIEIQPNMGWCDDPTHAAYNRLVSLPLSHSHELMWREDNLYDLVIVVDYNLKNPVPHKGSAIFIHQCRYYDGRQTLKTTAGCLALEMPKLLQLVEQATLDTFWVVSSFSPLALQLSENTPHLSSL